MVIFFIRVVEVGVWVGNRGVVCVWLVVIMYGAGAGRASPHWECLAGECPAMGRSRGGCRLVACAYADVRLTEREYIVSVVSRLPIGFFSMRFESCALKR